MLVHPITQICCSQSAGDRGEFDAGQSVNMGEGVAQARPTQYAVRIMAVQL